MKQLVAFFSVLQSLSFLAEAQTINRTLEAAPAERIVIELVDGDVTVRGWDEAVVEISGQLGNTAEDLEITQQGTETLIRIVQPAETDGEDTELFVSAPRGSSLAIEGTNLDILVAGIEGTLSLETVSGDIEAESYGAAIDAGTVGGDIRLAGRGAPGTASLSSVAGEIEAAGPFAVLSAASVSGDIELDVLDSESMSLSTTNGDIEVHATFDGAAELSAETTNGDVELEVGDAGDLNVDVGTFSGRIRTCFDQPADTTDLDAQAGSDGDGPRGRRRGQRGGELTIEADADSPRVRVRTLNGDIEICSS